MPDASPSNAPPTEPTPLKGPHARRRFTQHLRKLEPLLNDAATASALPGVSFFTSGARTPMFMLQALGRVYQNLDLDDKLFTEVRQESKIVEDALGAMDFWNVMHRQCQTWKLPDAVTQLVRDRYLECAGRTWAWIESQDWLPCRYHPDAEVLPSRFSRKLKKVDWPSPRKEAKLLTRWLHDELHTIHESIQRLDFNDIEGGLHKARREVRWVSIYFTAVEGAFTLDTSAEPPANWERYLTKEIMSNPYNRLPAPEADDVPIVVPAPLLYALSYAIDRLGTIKDKAQWTSTAEQYVHLANVKLDKPLAEYLGEQYLTHADASQAGRSVQEQVFIQDQLLLRMAEAIS